jgi:hypothetical protein
MFVTYTGPSTLFIVQVCCVNLKTQCLFVDANSHGRFEKM